jgi:hypothetical protein
VSDVISRLFTTDGLAGLLALPFVQSALIAAALLGVLAGCSPH